MTFSKLIAIGIATAIALPGLTQISADNTTPTTIEQNKISGGTIKGGNLFHSFDELNVPVEGIEISQGNFNGARINNIFIRVTGSEPSYIKGKIKTKESFPNANLYLINAQGIVFQPQGELELGGSFFGLTASNLQFQEQQNLGIRKTTTFPNGEVTSLEFSSDPPAPILNQGKLAVPPGRNLVLVGGSVFSDGALLAPNGNVVINAPLSGSRVEVRSTETTLGLTTITGVLEPVKDGVKDTIEVLRPAFPELPSNTQTVVTRSDGKVTLKTENPGLSDQLLPDGRVSTTGAFSLLLGDVSLKTIEAGNLQVEAPSDIVLLVPQISTTGSIALVAGSTITFRDSLEFPSNLRTNGNLLLRGDGRIDFLAINHPESTVKVGGNLMFISRRDILADSLFEVGGRVTVESSPSEQPDLFSFTQDLPKLLQPSPRLIRK